MKIYIMRHGTTVWNEKGITQGHSNNRLSKSGKELTEQVAKKFKDTKIDIIYCSPLFRTMQTANIVNKFHNVKIIKDNRLIEIDQGLFTGRKFSSLTEDEKIKKKEKSSEYKMESYNDVELRVKDFYENVLKKQKYQSVLIITHQIICSYLDNYISNRPNKKQFNIVENAQVKCFNI